MSITYLCGGRLGDFIHALYVVRGKYEETGKKGIVYITNDTTLGGDWFFFYIHITHHDLYPIVSKQPYIEKFLIHNNEPFDINLNDFRKHPNLFKDTWLELMCDTFSIPLIKSPWLNFDKIEKYKDVVLIHRSTHRHIGRFLSLLHSIIKNNQCLFITCNQEEYEVFPFKNEVSLDFKSNLEDLAIAIHSCRFFIGNQSSPLAFAYAMFKPILCEYYEGGFYRKVKHYKDISWMSNEDEDLSALSNYIQI